MYTLSYSGMAWVVDHVVKGSDYIRAYDANGATIVSFLGITDFADFEYNGTYMDPTECVDEPCNAVVYRNQMLCTRDGREIYANAVHAANNLHTHSASQINGGRLSDEVLPIVPVEKGGTGSTDGAVGLKNLFAAGDTVLSSYQYGTELPPAGNPGRIFFKIMDIEVGG